MLLGGRATVIRPAPGPHLGLEVQSLALQPLQVEHQKLLLELRDAQVEVDPVFGRAVPSGLADLWEVGIRDNARWVPLHQPHDVLPGR